MYQLSFININENKQYRKLVKQLYESSFPEDEQVPFLILRNKAKTKISDLYAITDQETFVGMLCTVYHVDIVFLWYLAVTPNMQGKGYGSQILQEVKKQFPKNRLILNIEEVNHECKETIKRKQFYLKNGFIESGFKTEEYGVVYEMLAYPTKITYPEYEAMMRKYSGDKIFEQIYKLVKE